MGRDSEDYGANVVDTAFEVAKIFRERAYAPYSNYKVGACVVAIAPNTVKLDLPTDTIYPAGTIKYFGGCNVENASYGVTICAERAAIFNAVGHGFKNIPIMAIVTENGGMSCGACRQVEYEFNPNMILLSMNNMGVIVERKLSDLLSNAFGPSDLDLELKEVSSGTRFIGDRRYA